VIRRSLFGALAFLFFASPVNADDAGVRALQAGGVALLRHAATAPGVGDPRGFRLEDCATQRNLNDEGRAESRRLGALLRERGVKVDRVFTSEWCRAIETAELLGFGKIETESALNDFYGRPQNREPQLAALKKLIAAWKGPGALVLVSHSSIIGALLQENPGTAAGPVLVPAPESKDGFTSAGQISPEG
jgi:phosphohistidine phosphatase SixA